MALAGSVACGPAGQGSFGASTYASSHGFNVAYQKGTRQVLPDGWIIENYYYDGHAWMPKNQDSYVTKYPLDGNGDGVVDGELSRFTYELRYEHRVHSGVIWLRSIPVSSKLRNKDLRVLMQDYVDNITGTTYEAVRLDRTRAQVVEHRQAAVVLEEGPATVAGRPAYAATVDVADVDQIKLAPGVRARRLQVVLLRAPLDERLEHDGKVTAVYPVVVLAGYSNMPTDFPTGLVDFHDFLRRVTIDGTAGLTLQVAPVEPSASTTTTSPAPAQ
ncbi:MAG TPA: hypothetical protein VFD36_07545 [Kofleriaceae bacterium]|nr:hypothetical protein [Kofleriaceae bacterium]